MQSQYTSLLMKMKWQVVVVFISSVHKPWLQNVCGKDEETIHGADDQTITKLFVFSFVLKETQINTELISVEQRGIERETGVYLLFVTFMHSGTCNHQHKVFTIPLWKVVVVLLSHVFTHLQRISILSV